MATRREALGALASIPFVQSVARMEVKQTTIVVVKTDRALTEQNRRQIVESWNSLWQRMGQAAPECIVLDQGMTIETMERA